AAGELDHDLHSVALHNGHQQACAEHAAERDQDRERHKKLHRRGQPQRVPHRGATAPERERRQRDDRGKERGLPDVVRHRRKRHHARSFLASFLSVRSASCTSSRVSFPASMRCATTGWVQPPKKLRNSSINRRCAVDREICGSKMYALPTFLTRRTAFLASRRDTIV